MKTKGYRQNFPGWLTREDGLVEAARYYKTEGAAFSGWIVRPTSDGYFAGLGNDYSDPIPTKAEAIEALLGWDR